MTSKTRKEPSVRSRRDARELDSASHGRRSRKPELERLFGSDDDSIGSGWGEDLKQDDEKENKKNGETKSKDKKENDSKTGGDREHKEKEEAVARINKKYQKLLAEEDQLAAAASTKRMEKYTEFLKHEAEMDTKRRIKKLELLEKQRLDEIAVARYEFCR